MRLYTRHARDVHVRAAAADMCARLLNVHTRQQLAQFMRNAAQEVLIVETLDSCNLQTHTGARKEQRRHAALLPNRQR